MRKRVVVAKYNEDISWINTANNLNIDFIIYDKSDASVKNFDDKIVVNNNLIKLMNIGRESHTYLRHIVDNYENLYDYEIFLQGRIHDHISEDIWQQISRIDNSDFTGFSYLTKYQCFSDEAKRELETKYPNNMHINLVEDASFNNYRVLGDRDFFEIAFGKNYDKDLYFEIKAHALFAVSKHSILRHPKELYQKYLDLHNPSLVSMDQVSSSPYKMEHFWKILFTFR
jgi:hypothetical protein